MTSIKNRLEAIDTIRGIAVLSMIVFHCFYDLNYIYGVTIDWFTSAIGIAWQLSIGFSFVFIAGISANFSRNNLYRAIKLGIIACLITIVTYFTKIDIPIWFGVIHCLATCTLICYFITPLLRNGNAYILLLTFFILSIMTVTVKDGSLWLFITIQLPTNLYEIPGIAFLGFPDSSFSSGDYYPLLPYLFVYLSGFQASRIILMNERFIQSLRPAYIKLFALIGCRSLPIYLIHQPVLLGLLYLIFAYLL